MKLNLADAGEKKAVDLALGGKKNKSRAKGYVPNRLARGEKDMSENRVGPIEMLVETRTDIAIQLRRDKRKARNRGSLSLSLTKFIRLAESPDELLILSTPGLQLATLAISRLARSNSSSPVLFVPFIFSSRLPHTYYIIRKRNCRTFNYRPSGLCQISMWLINVY